LLISFAPNHAVFTPYGGGIILIPLDMDGGRSPCNSFSNLSEPKEFQNMISFVSSTINCIPFYYLNEYMRLEIVPFHLSDLSCKIIELFIYLPVLVNMQSHLTRLQS
jgi:hypothetical protein